MQTNSDTVLSGKVQLVIGDLTQVGSIKSGGVSASQGSYIVRAGLEWEKVVKRTPFQADGNVRLSTVLASLATACGGTYVAPADVSLGRYSMRPTGAALDVIRALRSASLVPPWRIDATGRLAFGEVVSGEAGSGPRARERDLAAKTAVVVYSGSIKAWMPGCLFEGNRVQYTRIYGFPDDIKIEVGW
jgi:hypothetical protein